VTELHRLVVAQLAKATRSSGEVDCMRLCELMSTCYEEMERDRKRVDRANKLMQEELTQMTDDLERLIEELRVRNLHFQAALDNMSRGLCLLDAAGRLTVANQRFVEMYALAEAPGLSGRSMTEVLRDSPLFGSLQDYLALASAREPGSLQQNLPDGRIILVAHRPLESGGSVDTFEDVTERMRADGELAAAHKQLLDISRQAGMAEVATGVLHNVGNVLNSVNVAADVLGGYVQKSKGADVGRVAAALREHASDLGNFVTTHPQGRHLVTYLESLDRHLRAEREGAAAELEHLRKNIDHIKDIVSMQQSFALVAGVQEQLAVSDLVEESLRLSAAALSRHNIEIHREYADAPQITVDKHKVLQILVNLLTNAKCACVDSGRKDGQVWLAVTRLEGQVRIDVIDNGIGIAPENLTRIFNFGFTTRKAGHGFGLHSGALTARELGGSLSAHSDGPGRGARFTLLLPLQLTHSASDREPLYA
jgi:signal transduction histidine kinase